MSINKLGGLTLSSFTNVKPTVSLSDATTITTTPAKLKSHQTSTTNTSDDTTPLTSSGNTAEEILHHELEENAQKAARVEDLKMVVEAAEIAHTTSNAHTVNSEEEVVKESENESQITNLKGDRENLHVQPVANADQDAESSEEELEVLEELKDYKLGSANIEHEPSELPTLKIEKLSKSPSSSKKHLSVSPSGNPDIFSDDDESINEKAGLVPEDPPQVTQEEKLINETLVENDDITQSNEEEEISKEIEKEIEKEVHKIRSMSVTETQNNQFTSTEPVRGKLERLSTTESIKNISNPPPDLKKQEPFDFQTFLAQFKSKDCQPVHKYLKSFINQFNQRIWSIDEQVKLVSEFQEFLFNKLIEYKPFSEMGNDQNKVNNCKEGLEKLIMTKVYTSVYSPAMSFIKLTDVHKNDKIMDKKYLMNCYLYDWIELSHLDLDIEIDSKHIALVTKELSHINEFKSPRDKIVCILNACKIIFNFIRQNQETQENADSFVPLLIYVLIQSKIKNLYSNLKYIERFRNEDLLVGETSYYLSTLQISVNFIINISKDKLTIDEQEFENNILDAKRKLREMQKGGVTDESPSQVLTKSAEMVKQSLANSFNTLLQNIVPEDDEEEGGSSAQDRVSAARETERAELERARLLSLEEEEQSKVTAAQLTELSEMFPNLDASLIEDVYSACERDMTKAVDALLSL